MTRKHYVEFFSPGIIVSETRRKSIDQWDPHLATDMSAAIEERHSAKPYGFQFVTMLVGDPVPDGEGGQLTVTPKEVDRSGTHFITGELLFYDDIIGDKLSILKDNMRSNEFPICIENNNSWRFIRAFRENDLIVDKHGVVIRRGTDADLVAYREQKLAEWKAERVGSRTEQKTPAATTPAPQGATDGN